MTPLELQEAVGLYAHLCRLRGWNGLKPGPPPRLSAPEKADLYLTRTRLEELGMTQLDRRIDEARPKGSLSPDPTDAA